MAWSKWVLALGVVAGMFAPDSADAGCFRRRCALFSACGSWQCVEKQVCCPEWVTENRTVKCIECRPEQRERVCTVYERFPVTKMVQQQCTVIVPEKRTREVCQTVCRPVVRTVVQDVCVPVTVKEKRQGMRQVCKMQEVQETRTICEDQGCWQEQPCAPVACGCRHRCAHRCDPCAVKACDPCNPCVSTRKVWVPNIVQKQVVVKCLKPVMVCEPCEYEVCVVQNRVEKRQCQVTDYVRETAKKMVEYTVCVPKCEVRNVQCTTYECKPVQKKIIETVMVPHEVEKVVPVQVCKMATKTVTVKQWVPACRNFCCESAPQACAPAAACGT